MDIAKITETFGDSNVIFNFGILFTIMFAKICHIWFQFLMNLPFVQLIRKSFV